MPKKKPLTYGDYDPSEVTPLAREEYCGVCGQIGCSHDGIERN